MPFYKNFWLLRVECLATELCTAFPFTGREKPATHRGRWQPADAGRSPAGSRWGTAAAARSWKRSAQSRPGWSGKSPARRSRDAGTWGETESGRGGEGCHGYSCGRMGRHGGASAAHAGGELGGRKRITKIRGSRSTSFHFLISKHLLLPLVGMRSHVRKKTAIFILWR